MVSVDQLMESRRLVLEWLLRTQVTDSAHVNYGGFYRQFLYPKQMRYNNSSFTECVGMVMNTLCQCYVEDKDARILKALKLGADNYLKECQYAGSDPNIHGAISDSHGDPVTPESYYSFNNAEAMRALVRLYRITGERRYLQMATAHADWLVNVMLNPDGSYLTNYSQGMFNNPKVWNGNYTHQARVAWSLLEVWKDTQGETHREGAIRTLEWVLSKQHANGWFELCGNVAEFEMYCTEGLYYGGKILKNARYQEAAKKTIDAFCKVQQVMPGNFHFLYDYRWEPCPTDGVMDRMGVNLQFASLCYKLFLDTGDDRYLRAADACLEYVYRHQYRDSEDPRILGAIPEYTTWGKNRPEDEDLSTFSARFYLDAVDVRLDIFRGVKEYQDIHGMV